MDPLIPVLTLIFGAAIGAGVAWLALHAKSHRAFDDGKAASAIELAALQEQNLQLRKAQKEFSQGRDLVGKTLQTPEHPMLTYTYNFARSGNLPGMKKLPDEYPELLNLPVGTAGSTMLHTAAYNGQPQAVEELLRRGAKVNAQNRDGHTPLYDTALQGTKDTLLLLLQAKADASIPDTKGITPLKVAIDGERNEIAELLRQWGASE